MFEHIIINDKFNISSEPLWK